MWLKIVLVGSGGFLGAVLRFGVAELFQRMQWKGPIATVLVNYLGSFLLGLLLFSSFKGQVLSEHYRLLIAVGFCGALTTMSSFAFESVQLFSAREWLWAIGYMCAQVIGCFVMVFIAKLIV